MKKFFMSVILFISFFVSALPLYAQQQGAPITLEAKITDLTNEKKTTNKNQIMYVQKIQLKITSKGSFHDKSFTVTNDLQDQGKAVAYEKGEDVIVAYTKTPDGKETVYITDFVRRPQLAYLFFIFAALVLIIGRWHGLLSFVGLIFSFIIITSFVIPNILIGNNPILISLLASLFIIPASFYLAHGLGKKTTVAVVGTLIALMLTAGLSYIFVELTKLTGFAAEEATYLQVLKGGAINVKDLLLAGIIIGALGVLDDVTISQTSLVEKLVKTNPKFSFKQVYQHAMEIGRDHIASLVNTLILVYAGASLPLFLLFYDTKMSYLSVINQEIIATEIVRTLVSSIGIVMAVPITTIIACLAFKKK